MWRNNPGGPVEISETHPAVPAVRQAEESYRQRDADGCDAACARAVALARDDPRLRAGLATNHVARLLGLRELTRAHARCQEYLAGPDAGHVSLRILRAELLAMAGRVSDAEQEALEVCDDVLGRGGSLTGEEEARLRRIQGLAWSDRGVGAGAVAQLDRARGLFEELGDLAAVADIEREMAQLGVVAGDEDAARAVAAAGRRATAADEFVLGVALKRQCRYEEALRVMKDCALRADLVPTMRWPVLREIALLFRAVGRDDRARALTPLLGETAAQAADRPAAEAELARLLDPGKAPSGAFMERVQQARHLLGAGECEAPERILLDIRGSADGDAETAMWHLAAGELEFRRHGTGRGWSSHLADALTHLGLSEARSRSAWLVEVRVQALRLLGHAHFLSSAEGSGRRARKCWNEALGLEEGIVTRQVTDEVRRRMSLAVADTFDEWIDAAAAAGERLPGQATAAVVAAMEAARGASILPAILPGEASPVRELPRPGDHGGSWDWVGTFADSLPRSQAVWLMHAAPQHVHHAVMGRGFLFHTSVPCRRDRLEAAVRALARCWSSEAVLEKSQEGDDFGRRLAVVARLSGADEVIGRLPGRIGRIAVVAGDMLSDVPFGAVMADGVPLGVRFALSDLPCLSVLEPLRRRARRARGGSRLLVSPRPEGAPAPARMRARERVLDGRTPADVLSAALEGSGRHLTILDAHATPEALRAALAQRRHRLVRIHAHGRHHTADSGSSTLQLAPEGERGAMCADDLQQMDLSGCGTLVLGACETGMAGRHGRDERTGFVRAAFVAGAASAIAARWVARADVAAELLDRFECYARHLPRDVALQRAQRDLYEGATPAGTPKDPAPTRLHPAYWACWTLYGDSGFQTEAGPVRRTLRTYLTRRRYAGQR